MEKDPYQILQVIQKAEQEVIDAAYRGLARRYHPDINSSGDANERMKEINWAYEILRNPETRRAYDLLHNTQNEKTTPNQASSQPGETATGRSTPSYKDSSVRENKKSGGISDVWKFTLSLFLIFAGIYALITWSIPTSETSPKSAFWDASGHKEASVNYAATTDAGSILILTEDASKPTMTPMPTRPKCITWAEVSLEDVGKELCVRGIVITAYTAGDMFYMTFSQNPEDFYMVSYGGWYKEIKDNCVQGEGEIEQIGLAPIMVIDETNLYRCR